MFTKKVNFVIIIILLLTGFIGGFILYSIMTANNIKNDKSSQKEKISFESISFSNSIGKNAPDFSLESIDGKTIRLSDYRGKNVVLFFTEGSMCYPACWDQMAAFGNDERFNNNDIIAFSITPDTKDEWEKIIKKVPKLATAKILFDQTKAVFLSYDVLSLPSSMHKGSYPGHTYFLIDKEGFIRYVLDDPKMTIRNNELIAELNKLGR